MYECEKHGYWGYHPCSLCKAELEMKKPAVPQPVIKHVHAPGPCPDCALRANRDTLQRWALLLAVLLGIVGFILVSISTRWLPEAWRALLFAPAAIVALVGVFLRVPRSHSETP